MPGMTFRQIMAASGLPRAGGGSVGGPGMLRCRPGSLSCRGDPGAGPTDAGEAGLAGTLGTRVGATPASPVVGAGNAGGAGLAPTATMVSC
jgi:hypothetical protein